MSKKTETEPAKMGAVETIPKAELDRLRARAKNWSDLVDVLLRGLEKEMNSIAEDAIEERISTLSLSVS